MEEMSYAVIFGQPDDTPFSTRLDRILKRRHRYRAVFNLQTLKDMICRQTERHYKSGIPPFDTILVA